MTKTVSPKIEYHWYCGSCHRGFTMEPSRTKVTFTPYCPFCGKANYVERREALQLAMMDDPPKSGRYKPGSRHWSRRHVPTDAEEDQIVADYKKGIPPSVICEKYDISPGRLYQILPKHHIALIYKPKQKKLKLKEKRK